MPKTTVGRALDALAEQVRDVDYESRIAAASRAAAIHRRTRIGVAPTLATAVVLAFVAAVAVTLGANRGAGSLQPGSDEARQETTLGGLTLRFPASWHAVRPSFNTTGLMVPLGWITNVEPGPQCTGDQSEGTGCHGPVTRLGSGDLQIAVQSEGGNADIPDHIAANSTLAGLSAQRIETTAGCDSSAVSGAEITAVTTSTSVLRLILCFGPDTSEQQSRVRAMLDSASYKGEK